MRFRLLSAVALLLPAAALPSCAPFSQQLVPVPQPVQMRILPSPIPQEPVSPWVPNTPVMQVMTADTAAYYAEACDAWGAVGRVDAWSEAEVRARYPGLEQVDACDWALFGMTAESEIAFEKDLAAAAAHMQALRAWGRALKAHLTLLYARLEAWSEADQHARQQKN